MNELIFDYSKALGILQEQEMDNLEPDIINAHDKLHNKTGEGKEYLGWLDLPLNHDKNDFSRIKKAAKKIQGDSDVLLVIGIGGSYLGARSAIEMLTHSFYNMISHKRRQAPQILYIGHQMSATYMQELFDVLADKDISVNVISKSGTTTEPALAFRFIRAYLEKKYGQEEAAKRIYATTDKEKGALKIVAEQAGYQTFVIPDNVGGRFSVLTAVGLLPIAVAGIDINEMMQGAVQGKKLYDERSLDKNPAYQYAAVRNILYRKGKLVEIMVNYEPGLHYFCEWWKQLFGESEGKDRKGILPAGVDFTTDLHSMGQYIQDGRRIIFETVLTVKNPRQDIIIEKEADNSDGLNYLAGKTVNYVNHQAFQGTLLAHTDGDAPNMLLTIDEMNAYCFGLLVYFFQKACGISGYLLGVNPFDQAGVEAYKTNMFALLGKPGYEDKQRKLNERLK